MGKELYAKICISEKQLPSYARERIAQIHADCINVKFENHNLSEDERKKAIQDLKNFV